jgi:hypothetical protein
MHTEKVLKEVEQAFPFVQKPKGIDISFHRDDCAHCQYLRGDLEEYDQPEIPRAGIRAVHSEMSCLSAAGWRWVLPSYLRQSLANTGDIYDTETEYLIYNLGPDQKYQTETLERLSALNSQQIACLIHFLEWCADHEHWSDYCPEEINRGLEFLRSVA